MAKRKSKPYKIGQTFTTRYNERIEITACYDGWWGGEPGYHIKIDGKYPKDVLGGIAYITDGQLERMLK